MKKMILGVAFGAALLVGGFALNTEAATAKVAPISDTGSDTYVGGGKHCNPTPKNCDCSHND